MENMPVAENRVEFMPLSTGGAARAEWGIGAGLLTWFMSVFFLFAWQFVAFILYLIKVGSLPTDGKIDWLLAMLSIGSTFPAHLMTLLFCWFIVSERGQQPFWQSLGWGWHPQFKWVHATALAFLMMGVGALCAKYLPQQETELEKILKMGQSIRVLTALMAVLSAPLVEEVVYRGVLFVGLTRATIRQSCLLLGAALGLATAALYWQTRQGFSLQRVLLTSLVGFGAATILWGLSEVLATRSLPLVGQTKTLLTFAVINVAALFALVHMPQYWGSWAAITTIVLLSVVLTALRAVTNSVLPGIATHFIYNGVQGIGLLLGMDDSLKEKTTQAAFSVFKLGQATFSLLMP